MKRLSARAQIGIVRAYRRTRNTRAKSRITRVVTVAGRAELPEGLNPRRVYLIGTTPPKWALIDCPCGRGHVVELNLANPARIRWKVTTSKTGQPSIHPSIDYRGQPRCHFWLKDGRIHWVPSRTRS